MSLKNIGEFQNQEAERAVIHLLLVNHKQTKIHLPDIHVDYFFYPNHKEIFKAIKELTENGESVDTIIIKKKIKNITSTLTDVLSATPSISSIKSYIKILKDHADKRWFVQSCHQASESKGGTHQTMGKLSTDIIGRLRDRDRKNS